MKQIKLREFQRNFSKYKNIACGVLDNGKLIGEWKPLKDGLNMPVGQGLRNEIVEKVRNIEFRAKDCVSDSDLQIEETGNGLDNTVGHTCEKCQKESSDVYVIWEEGEERKVCLGCIKSLMPSKMLKGFLRKAQKL